MALEANQFSYLDATFVMMFFIFCILDICNIKVTKWIGIPMTLCGLFFLMMAFTSGYHQLFYRRVEHELYKGSAHLSMEFGPFYTPFVLYAVLMMLIPIGIIVYSAFNKRKISYKYTMALGCLLVAIGLMYFIEMGIGLGLGFDILPSGYLLMEYVILVVINRIGLYDVSQMAVHVSEYDRDYGCIIFDTKRCYVGANDTAKYYFPELLALDIDREVSDPWIATEFVEWTKQFDAREKLTKRYERKDRSLRCSMKPYQFGKKQRSYGYVVEILDDTEQQNFLQTLNAMNEELEIAAQQADAANEAKSQFLASMSHEIRTPINAILGMNQIALRECKEEALISYLQDIRSAGDNLLAIINEILDFSKIEAGKINTIEEEYELAKLLQDVLGLLDIKAKEKGLLEPTAAKVIICSSGKACLKMLEHKKFDIVFMDHMMPEMDGIETLQKIKESSEIDADDTAFVALTANAISAIREMYLEAGFDDYLSKPIDLEKMEEMIQKYCFSSK